MTTKIRQIRMSDINNYPASCNLISKMFAQRIWRNFSALGMIKDLAITLEIGFLHLQNIVLSDIYKTE